MVISEAVCGSPSYLSSPVWNEDPSPNIAQPSTRTPTTITQRLTTTIRFILLPNGKVSDGGGHHASEFANRRCPPPFAPPKSWAPRSPESLLPFSLVRL